MSSKPSSTPCKDLLPWLRDNVGESTMGALTGTDVSALKAGVHVLLLMQYTIGAQRMELGAAFKTIVECMQPSTQWAAYHAVAYVFDWEHRAQMWMECGLSRYEDGHKPPHPLPNCKHGPEAREARLREVLPPPREAVCVCECGHPPSEHKSKATATPPGQTRFVVGVQCMHLQCSCTKFRDARLEARS